MKNKIKEASENYRLSTTNKLLIEKLGFENGAEWVLSQQALSPLEQSDNKEEWVSVAERLPESGVDMLVYGKTQHNEYICIGWIESDQWEYQLGDYMEVTHWKPLPSRPASTN